MGERFKPIFKVDYSLVRDENGNQDLYCKTSDNVSIISEHYLGNIKDIVGYIKENQQLKEKLERSEKARKDGIHYIRTELLCFDNESIEHIEGLKILNILDIDNKGE